MAKKKLTIEDVLVPKDEIPYEVPENWCWVKLGSVIKVTSGKNLTKSKMNENGKIPVYGGNGFVGHHDDFNVEESKIIIGRVGANCGNVHITESKGWITDNAFIVSYDDKLFYKMYMYYLLSECDLGKYSNSSAQPVISGQKIYDVAIQIPPLAEQERIVKRIESLFEKVDKARELVDEARDGFEKRRAAILEKAFSGELTRKWRDENGVSDEWNDGIFEDLCVLKRGYDLPSYNRVSGEYSLVSSSGINDTHNEYKVEGPGITVGRSGSVGKVFYVEDNFWPLNTTLYVQNFKDNDVKYVYYYLSNFNFKPYSSSTAVPTLNRNNFKNVPTKIPSLNEQKEIVRILENVLIKEKEVDEISDIKETIDIIKKSILAKAFRGELGGSDIDDENSISLLKDLIK